MHESIIIVLPLPPASPTRLQYYCITIAQYSTAFRPPDFTPYNIQYCALQYLVKAKVRMRQGGCLVFGADPCRSPPGEVYGQRLFDPLLRNLECVLRVRLIGPPETRRSLCWPAFGDHGVLLAAERILQPIYIYTCVYVYIS